MMKSCRKLIVLTITFVLIDINGYSQFKAFSGIHDSIDSDVLEFVSKAGFSMVTYYFDDLSQKDGIWELYPSLKISDNLVAVNISTISGHNTGYNYIIIIDVRSKSIVDTLGPFYDSFVDAIEPKLKDNQVVKLKVRLVNPPEPEMSKYTIIEYVRSNSKLIKIKSYDKN